MPGPPPKLNRTRARDTKVTERMAWDGQVRGFDLPDDALAPGEEWHPMVVKWWEAFRRSPQARLLSSDVQWSTLVLAARIYQDVWAGPDRGRAVRAGEVRQLLSQYLVTPADARRAGIEFVLPGAVPDSESTDAAALDEVADKRRKRLLAEEG